MTKRSASSTIDLTRITETQRRQIDRVVEIGACIGINQQKQHRDILKAMTRSLHVALEATADADRESSCRAARRSLSQRWQEDRAASAVRASAGSHAGAQSCGRAGG